ncbi:MAG TPA: SpoIID/LytB domain-containing protein [Actinomycetota bacterium]
MATATVVVLTAGALLLADASPIESHPSRALIVTGRGFGHGRGLGQWGARGMAEQGADWRRIVSHYYRAASVSRSRPIEVIRVRVQIARRMIGWSSKPFTVASGDRRSTVQKPEALVRVRRAGAKLIVERARRRSGPWRRMMVTEQAVVVRAGRAPVWLFRPGGGLRAYEGAIVVRPRREQLAAVNHVAFERYVASVLPREMPASWPGQALRAQAVAARTYAANVAVRARRAGMTHDICASTGCQVYGGVAWRESLSDRPTISTHPRATGATRATVDRILTYRGRAIFAQYSSSTGGYTDRGDAPYLRAVPDPADRISPHHAWRRVIPASALESRWPDIGTVTGVRVTKRSGVGAWGGRVRRMVVEGSRGRIGLSGDRFQAVFGLRSDWYVVRWRRHLFARDMGEGARGHAVRHLQHRLLEEGFYPRSAPRTTYFGPITRDSLKRYQRARGISSTGYLGPKTRRSLNRRA